MNSRPVTTLFLLMSLDGKINSGASDELDVDKDWQKIEGVKEGLHQYYEIEQTTDFYSLNTGRVMAKIGVNDKKEPKEKIPVRFIIVDRRPNLTESGVEYLCKWVDRLFLVTDNKDHPAFKVKEKYENLEILYYEDGIDLERMLTDMKEKYGAEKVTIQSGGTLNGEFLRENLIDFVNIVIAPILVGGKETNTLIDGRAIMKVEELNKLKAMRLLECEKLEDSYIRLKYEVIK
ncbi:MAG: dihydrofolate reductase family protein [Clostridiaceae bacterium]